MGMTKSQREAHGIQFTVCPECSQEFGTAGLASHRKAAHNVQPVTAKKVAPVKLSLAERLARIDAMEH